MPIQDNLGKLAEKRVAEQQDRPSGGYYFERILDQLSRFYSFKNICDFFLYKSPNMYFIELKATHKDRFDFTMITEYQWTNLLSCSKIDEMYGLVLVLFATSQRATILDIQGLEAAKQASTKSLNITKIVKSRVKVPRLNNFNIEMQGNGHPLALGASSSWFDSSHLDHIVNSTIQLMQQIKKQRCLR